MGKRLGAWQVEGLLGSGGQGSVWLASKREIDGGKLTAAIKTLNTGNSVDPGSSDNLAHEHQMLREIKSPYLAKYLDSGVEIYSEASKSSQIQWLAIEYVSGRSLREEIRNDGVLDESSWFELAHDVLSALATIHAKGIIHSDVKPDNIMRSSRKSVLVDLGAASLAGIRDTGDINAISTVEFAAPEQIDGGVDAKDYGYEVDVFSLGMTLVYAATGAPAWDDVYRDQKGNVKQSALRQHFYSIQNNPPRLAGMSIRQKELVLKMLGFNPASRTPAAALLRNVKDALPAGSSRKNEEIAEKPVRWIPQTSNGSYSKSAAGAGKDESQPKWLATSLIVLFGYGIGPILRFLHFNSQETWRYSARRAEYVLISTVAYVSSLGIIGFYLSNKWQALGASKSLGSITLAGIALTPIYLFAIFWASLSTDASQSLLNALLGISSVAVLGHIGIGAYLSTPPKVALSN